MLQPSKSRTPLLDALLPLLAAARPVCRQERTFTRLAVLTLGLLVTLGRRTVSQVRVSLGAGDQSWAAWHRLFSAVRIDHAVAERQVLTEGLRHLPTDVPLVVALDATHLPRTGRQMPGVGWARAPRTPVFKLGIQRAQRWVGLNLLLPRTAGGMSRALPHPVADLLAWAWQRWEVEVMHRELKSTFGLGQSQAWSPGGTVGTTRWLVWSYALLVLAGYRCWGLGPGPGRPLAAWQRPRRWSLGTLWAAYRAELWHLGDFQPVWTRSPDSWAEMAAWLATQTNAGLGLRHL